MEDGRKGDGMDAAGLRPTERPSKVWRVARWTDANGANTLAGFVIDGSARFALLTNYGRVEIPDGAEVSAPAYPVAEVIGTVDGGEVR